MADKDSTFDLAKVAVPTAERLADVNRMLANHGCIQLTHNNFTTSEGTKNDNIPDRHMKTVWPSWKLHGLPSWLKAELKKKGDIDKYGQTNLHSHGEDNTQISSFIDHHGSITERDESCFITQPYAPHFTTHSMEYCRDVEHGHIKSADEFAEKYNCHYEIIRPGPWHHHTIGFKFKAGPAKPKEEEKFVHAQTSKQAAPKKAKPIQVQVPTVPPVPSEAIPIDDVAKLPAFAGVYIAYILDEVVYVGESENVSDRCRKRRNELNDVTHVSVIRCPAYMRLRIEAYFIGLFNPPRNSESTHDQLKSRTPRAADPTIYMAQANEVFKKDSVTSLSYWNDKWGYFQIDNDGELLMPNIHGLNDCVFHFHDDQDYRVTKVVQVPPGMFQEKKGDYWKKPSKNLDEFRNWNTHVWIKRLRAVAKDIHSGSMEPSILPTQVGVTVWSDNDSGLVECPEYVSLEKHNPEKLHNLKIEVLAQQELLKKMQEDLLVHQAYEHRPEPGLKNALACESAYRRGYQQALDQWARDCPDEQGKPPQDYLDCVAIWRFQQDKKKALPPPEYKPAMPQDGSD